MFWIFAIIFATLSVSQGKPFEPIGRIVNGSNADIVDFPFMVSVKILLVHACGGTILDEYNILTAAHCAIRYPSCVLVFQKVKKVFASLFPPNLYSVQYGTANISRGNTIRVENYTVHEEYAGYTESFNDVAIMHLSSPLPFGDNVQPVTLSTDHSATPENADAVLIGWGFNETHGTFQKVLQRVDIKVYPDEECQRVYNTTNSNYQLCAGVSEGGKGQCEGDSGGPLLVNGVEVGIVSWSHKPCTGKGYPGVFTKVSTYRDWIKDHLKKP